MEDRGDDKQGLPYNIEYTLTLCQGAGLENKSVSLLCILGQL